MFARLSSSFTAAAEYGAAHIDGARVCVRRTGKGAFRFKGAIVGEVIIGDAARGGVVVQLVQRDRGGFVAGVSYFGLGLPAAGLRFAENFSSSAAACAWMETFEPGREIPGYLQRRGVNTDPVKAALRAVASRMSIATATSNHALAMAQLFDVLDGMGEDWMGERAGGGVSSPRHGPDAGRRKLV